MKTQMMEKNIFLSIDANDYMEILPGFIPEKKDKPGKINKSAMTEKDSIKDIRKNIVHLEICLTRIKDNIKSL